jgi:hypothetical protein
MAAELAETMAAFPKPLKLWLKPVQPALDVVLASKDKTVGELTMPEVMAWVCVFGYAALTGIVAGRVTANVVAVALRGPYRR